MLLDAPVSNNAWNGTWKIFNGILGVDSFVIVVNFATCRDLRGGSSSTDPKLQLIPTGFPDLGENREC